MERLTRSNSIEVKYIRTLDIYNDKAFVYSVLCMKSARFYNTLKYSFQIPLILSSTALTFLNSNSDKSIVNHMKIANPIINIMTAVLLAINNMFKFEAKANDFKNTGMKFQKLSHLIESKILSNDVPHDFIVMIVDSYDNIASDSDDPPLWLCNSIRKQYGTKKHLPTICNGVAKIEPLTLICNDIVIDDKIGISKSVES